MEEVSGKASAHINSLIVMNLAAVEIHHSTALDFESPTLPMCQIRKGNVRETSSNGVMEEGSANVQKVSAHVSLRKRETYVGNVSEAASNGVMEEGSGKVHRASTYVQLRTRETYIGNISKAVSNGVLEEGACKLRDRAEDKPPCPW